MLLQSGHLALQAHHYTLPPLEGALWQSLGQVLQDPRMMTQELEELLKTEMVLITFLSFLLIFLSIIYIYIFLI